MAVLSSRQPTAPVAPQQAVIDAAQPSVNIVLWLSSMMKFTEDSPEQVQGAQTMLEEALECMLLEDFAVLAVPGISTNYLHFEVAVKPFVKAPYVFFRTQFQIV